MTQTVLLGDISKYVTDKIPVGDVSLSDYVSTENLIPDKGGLSLASNLPRVGKVTSYQVGDVLVSNIRPYFKKIWFADRCGGASNDVLVFRPKDGSLYSKYLFYVLANDEFFDYSTASSSGSKMPRGDKTQILKYPVHLPSFEEQQKIADILWSIDEKNELNRRMNEILEQMGQAFFKHYFIDNPAAKTWPKGKLEDLVNVLSGFAFKRSDFIEDGKYGLVTIKNVQDGSFVADCTDHIEKAPKNVPKHCFLSVGEILLSLTGNVGRTCSVTGNNLLLNQRVAKIEPLEHTSLGFVYFMFRSPGFKERLIGISRGTAQMNLSPIETKKLTIPTPPNNTLTEFSLIIDSLYQQLIINNSETTGLIQLRDSLLPRLISGRVVV